MSILQTYQPLIDINPAKASLLDQSGNGYALTVSGNVRWTNLRKKRALRFTGNGLMLITRQAALDAATSMTILVFGDVPNRLTGNDQHIYDKGAQAQFYINSTTGVLALFSGVTSSVSGIDVRGAKMVGVSCKAAEKPVFYKNGNYVATGNNALALATDANNGSIGNYYASAGVNFCSSAPTYRVLVFDQILTAQVISQIYDEVEAELGAGDPKTGNYKFGINKVNDSTLVCHLDAGVRRADGYYVDLSGNGNNGQAKGMTATTKYPFGTFARSNGIVTGCGVGMGAMNAKASLTLGTNDFSYGGWFNTGDLSVNAYFVAAYSANPLFFLQISTSGSITYRMSDGVNNVSKTYVAGLAANKDVHVVVSNDKSGNAVLYLNGAAVDSVNISSVGSMTTANELLLMTYSSYASALSPLKDGGFKEFRLYNGKALSATEVKNWYNEYATKPTYLSQSEYWTSTLANVTEGRIGNTDFKVSTGTWKVSEDANKQKWIENVGAGVAYMPFDKAYGTWVFDVYKGGDGTSPVVLFASHLAGNQTTSGQNSYQFLITTGEGCYLRESTSGSDTTKSYTANSYVTFATKYQIAISRDLNGLFTMYIKGGVYTNWTLIDVSGGGGSNPTTDTTITSSSFFNLDLDAGDKISDIRHYQGVLDLTTLPLN